MFIQHLEACHHQCMVWKYIWFPLPEIVKNLFTCQNFCPFYACIQNQIIHKDVHVDYDPLKGMLVRITCTWRQQYSYTSILFTIQNVIVYCGWHVWLQSTMTAWSHQLKVSIIPTRSPSRQRDVGLWHRRYIYQTGNHLHADCREKRCSNPTTNHRESGLLRQMACVQTDSAETRSSTWNSSLYLINFHI